MACQFQERYRVKLGIVACTLWGSSSFHYVSPHWSNSPCRFLKHYKNLQNWAWLWMTITWLCTPEVVRMQPDCIQQLSPSILSETKSERCPERTSEDSLLGNPGSLRTKFLVQVLEIYYWPFPRQFAVPTSLPPPQKKTPHTENWLDH